MTGHMLGLEALKKYSEHNDIRFEVRDNLTPRQVQRRLRYCGDTLAVFIYNECLGSTSAQEAFRRLDGAVDDLVEVAARLRRLTK